MVWSSACLQCVFSYLVICWDPQYTPMLNMYMPMLNMYMPMPDWVDKFWVETILLKNHRKMLLKYMRPNSWKHQDKTRETVEILAETAPMTSEAFHWKVQTGQCKSWSSETFVDFTVVHGLDWHCQNDAFSLLMPSPRVPSDMSNSRQPRDWKSEQLRAHSPVCAEKTAFVFTIMCNQTHRTESQS